MISNTIRKEYTFKQILGSEATKIQKSVIVVNITVFEPFVSYHKNLIFTDMQKSILR